MLEKYRNERDDRERRRVELVRMEEIFLSVHTECDNLNPNECDCENCHCKKLCDWICTHELFGKED